nr:MAG TPA: hypothetical protein [Caudoviricetes sp.]
MSIVKFSHFKKVAYNRYFLRCVTGNIRKSIYGKREKK